MTSGMNEAEASFALQAIQRRRQQVVAEIRVPAWYWFGLAAGWVGLGILGGYGPAWAVTIATLAFGAVHSAVAPRVISGRHGSSRLSVRTELVSRRLPAMILGFLVVMTAVTVGLAMLLVADGARHPVVWASVVVAALVLTGGPGLVAWTRARAERGLED